MFDGIVIPGGGLLPDHGLPPSRRIVRWRFRNAGNLFGSPQGAECLLARGVQQDWVLPESLSNDTIGNAFFAR